MQHLWRPLSPAPRSSRRYDYVEVYNGGDEHAPMLGKFCGKIAPSPIISSGGQLLIKFVSDYETHGAGFSVRYEILKTGGCVCVSRCFNTRTSEFFPGDSRSSEPAS